MTTVAELKRQLHAVMQLPDDTPLCTATAYGAMLAARKALTRAVGESWGAKGDELEAIRSLSLASLREERQRRRPGRTGSFDTPWSTWEAMRVASLAGETLRSLSERFRVIYYAVLRRRNEDRENGVPWGGAVRRRTAEPTNVILFPRKARA